MSDPKVICEYEWNGWGCQWKEVKALPNDSEADLKYRVLTIKDDFQLRSGMAFMNPMIYVIIGAVIMLVGIIIAAIILLFFNSSVVGVLIAILIGLIAVIAGVGLIVWGFIHKKQVVQGGEFNKLKQHEFQRHLVFHNMEVVYDTTTGGAKLVFRKMAKSTMIQDIASHVGRVAGEVAPKPNERTKINDKRKPSGNRGGPRRQQYVEEDEEEDGEFEEEYEEEEEEEEEDYEDYAEEEIQ